MSAAVPVRIFLSHSSKDMPSVDPIRAQAMGIDVYLHEHDPQPGIALAKKLTDALAKCDALLVLVSAHSVPSPYVNQEVGVAIGRAIPIIPLVEKGVQQELLAMLQGVEYIEFDREQPQAALTTLTAHLHSMQLRKNQKHQQDEVLMALAVVGLILLFMYFAEGSAPAA